MQIFINGNIYTMNQDAPFANAIVISGDKIEYVGTNQEALTYKKTDTEVKDLKKKMMLPGFIDAHCHPMLAAFWGSGIVLDVDMNRDEVLAAINLYIEDHPEKKSYFGIGYAEWNYDEKGPHKKYMDEICSEKPIFILGSSGHEGWCNSKALEMAQVTKNTADPLPGLQYFERDQEGNPTGHIVECGATKIISSRVDWFDPQVVTSGLDTIFRDYSQMGVTSLIDCGILGDLDELALSYIVEYMKENLLRQRICGCVMVEERFQMDTAIKTLDKRSREHCDDEFFINTLKIINDGAIESRSASMFEPYTEDGSMVYPMAEGQELEDICVEAAQKGYDIHIHAIGDKAIHETLKAAKAIRSVGCHDTRITNAHTEHVRSCDNRLFGKYNVIANTTGTWHYGNPTMPKIVGDKRAKEQFRMLSILKEGARMSLGSDLPVDEYGAEPLKGIQVAVTRQLYNDPEGPVLLPESEKLSVQQCLEGYTINAAYQMHMEDRLGSLEPGKYADLVVLEKDLFEIPVLEIYKTRVMQVIKGGKVTFSQE